MIPRMGWAMPREAVMFLPGPRHAPRGDYFNAVVLGVVGFFLLWLLYVGIQSLGMLLF
jgi:hypothetical protein